MEIANKQEKKVKNVVIFAMIVNIILIGCLIFMCNGAGTAFAEEISESNINTLDNISATPEGMEAIDILKDRRAFYAGELAKAVGDNKENIAAIISTIDEAIEDYGNNLIAQPSVNALNVLSSSTDITNSEYESLVSEIVSIATGFEARGWHLEHLMENIIL